MRTLDDGENDLKDAFTRIRAHRSFTDDATVVNMRAPPMTKMREQISKREYAASARQEM